MMGRYRVSLGELVSLLLVGGVCAAILVGSASLPGPEYDPLGPAGMPNAIAFVMLVLALLRVGQIVLGRSDADDDAGAPSREGLEIRRTLLAAALVVAYLVGLSVGGLPFAVQTFLFLALLGMAMTRFARDRMALVVVIALAASVGLSYVFSEVLGVVLPG